MPPPHFLFEEMNTFNTKQKCLKTKEYETHFKHFFTHGQNKVENKPKIKLKIKINQRERERVCVCGVCGCVCGWVCVWDCVCVKKSLVQHCRRGDQNQNQTFLCFFVFYFCFHAKLLTLRNTSLKAKKKIIKFVLLWNVRNKEQYLPIIR